MVIKYKPLESFDGFVVIVGVVGVVGGLVDEVLFDGFAGGAGPFFFVFFFLSDLLFHPFDAVALDASLF